MWFTGSRSLNLKECLEDSPYRTGGGGGGISGAGNLDLVNIWGTVPSVLDPSSLAGVHRFRRLVLRRLVLPLPLHLHHYGRHLVMAKYLSNHLRLGHRMAFLGEAVAGVPEHLVRGREEAKGVVSFPQNAQLQHVLQRSHYHHRQPINGLRIPHSVPHLILDLPDRGELVLLGQGVHGLQHMPVHNLWHAMQVHQGREKGRSFCGRGNYRIKIKF